MDNCDIWTQLIDADKDDDGLEEGEERDEPKPRALHKTLSIFLRNLPCAVTKQEVEEVCIGEILYSYVSDMLILFGSL